MPTYVMLTRLSPEALSRNESVEELNQRVVERIRSECPDLRWLANYAVMGPYDYLDIFEAPDNQTAGKASFIVRSFGHATTETWTATPWEQFVQMASQVRERTAARR